jgi:ribosome modulation factor
MRSTVPIPENQEPLHSDTYQAGLVAANNGRQADSCPYPTSIRRKQWMAGFFSAKPLLKKPCCQHE